MSNHAAAGQNGPPSAGIQQGPPPPPQNMSSQNLNQIVRSSFCSLV